MMALASMKWPFNVIAAMRRRFYARDRKGNGTIFGSARQPAESNLRDRILCQEPDHDAVARTLCNVRATAREKSLRRCKFPESNCSSGLATQNDFLFNYPRIHLLEFSHDPTGQSHVS